MTQATENPWLSWAKRLQAIAHTGLHFATDDFDLERYQEVEEIAQQMLGQLANAPVSAIQDLLDNSVRGYATPLVDVRGALIHDNKILLVREKSDGGWTLPGGFADVGLSAVENVIKEVREEAGLDVSLGGVYAIRHKAKHPYRQDLRDFYKLFFLCEHSGEPQPSVGPETSDVAFFSRRALPNLSTTRTLEADIFAAFNFLEDRQVRFD